MTVFVLTGTDDHDSLVLVFSSRRAAEQTAIKLCVESLDVYEEDDDSRAIRALAAGGEDFDTFMSEFNNLFGGCGPTGLAITECAIREDA